MLPLPPQLAVHHAAASYPSLVSETASASTECSAKRLQLDAEVTALEVRLGASEQIDIGVRIDAAGGGCERLGVNPDPVLQRVGAGWATRTQSVPFIFVEVDSASPEAGGRSSALTSGVFARVQSSEAVVWEDALDWLAPATGNEGREALCAFMKALPATAHPLHLGAMPGRKDTPLRWFGSFAEGDCGPFLREMGFGDRVDVLLDAAQRYGPGHRSRMIQLDLLEGPNRHLGLEIDCRPWATETAQNPWGELLDLLTHDGFCLSEKAQALRQWPGSLRARVSGSPCPFRLIRDISHVKLSIDDDGVRDAKAYIYTEGRPELFD